MRFIISGQAFDLNQNTVLEAVSSESPEPIDGRHKYYVVLRNRRYPIKQVLSLATGLRKGQFTAQYAEHILPKLGFPVLEYEPARPRQDSSPGHLPRSPMAASQATEGAAGKKTRARFAVTMETDEDGFVLASCPSLPGCHSQGRSREEAVANVREAIRGYIASMRKHQEEVPDSDWEVVEVDL